MNRRPALTSGHGTWMMMMMMMIMMISKFNGTPTPKGSYSAKAGVNCPMSLNRVH